AALLLRQGFALLHQVSLHPLFEHVLYMFNLMEFCNPVKRNFKTFYYTRIGGAGYGLQIIRLLDTLCVFVYFHAAMFFPCWFLMPIDIFQNFV
ncbi:MAG: hypothetical protein LBQ69_00780, partial [Treponema sp.]|nr:hypothetical protein [Treponema sp.]